MKSICEFTISNRKESANGSRAREIPSSRAFDRFAAKKAEPEKGGFSFGATTLRPPPRQHLFRDALREKISLARARARASGSLTPMSNFLYSPARRIAIINNGRRGFCTQTSSREALAGRA